MSSDVQIMPIAVEHPASIAPLAPQRHP